MDYLVCYNCAYYSDEAHKCAKRAIHTTAFFQCADWKSNPNLVAPTAYVLPSKMNYAPHKPAAK